MIMSDDLDNRYIGMMCSIYRRYELRLTQEEFAKETGYSREAISKFEHGTQQSALLFIHYIKRGIFNWMPIDYWGGLVTLEGSD